MNTHLYFTTIKNKTWKTFKIVKWTHIRSEPLELGDPVGDGGERDHHQEWPINLPVQHHGHVPNALDGFPQAHLIRQDPVNAILPQHLTHTHIFTKMDNSIYLIFIYLIFSYLIHIESYFPLLSLSQSVAMLLKCCTRMGEIYIFKKKRKKKKRIWVFTLLFFLPIRTSYQAYLLWTWQTILISIKLMTMFRHYGKTMPPGYRNHAYCAVVPTLSHSMPSTW